LTEHEEQCADPSVEVSLRIDACTALIQSGKSSTEDLATAYLDRGNAYQDKSEYDRAIQDYCEAIHLKPQFELAIYDRANAYGSKGEYDHAIADYDQVIELAPEGDHVYFAYYGRGYAFSAKGEYDHAIKDYDQAIRLNPDSANAFIVRGIANFLGANPALAVIDLRRSSELNPKIAYSLLWLHLARARLGEGDSKELVKRSAKADLSRWPGPVLELYLGRITTDQMMAAAADPDLDVEKQKLCEADFFAGEDALLHLHYSAARLLLEKAVDSCPLKNLHHGAAAAELKRLNVTAKSAKPNS
jgi:lipoprotein NlpI